MKQIQDEAFLVGQVASLIAVMSALVQALPSATRRRLLEQLTPQFESLIAAMQMTGESDTQAACKGAEWVRGLFLRQIAKADKKTPRRKASIPANEALDIQL